MHVGLIDSLHGEIETITLLLQDLMRQSSLHVVPLNQVWFVALSVQLLTTWKCGVKVLVVVESVIIEYVVDIVDVVDGVVVEVSGIN